MSVIKLEPKTSKPDLKVEYLGKVYTLPGTISAAMLEKLFFASDKESPEGFLKMFLAEVMPKDFKSVIAQDDLGPLSQIWVEHIQGPKESGSTE
jgi:hypothetical protein